MVPEYSIVNMDWSEAVTGRHARGCRIAGENDLQANLTQSGRHSCQQGCRIHVPPKVYPRSTRESKALRNRFCQEF